ncbi:hypothetical protein [Leptospira sp. id769339]|uniref:hypothetical protein n=1 Tax=Leptospira sp. id769339 TaxID=2864221 RepID=UPI00214B0610|nr:hypothetical protein [Leptospira sp. id769339]MCR1795540.1 hypothetical protein [Leptospira sp. id769339]
MATNNSSKSKEDEVFPGWLAKTISENLNRRYLFFLREKRPGDKWISWAKCAQDSHKKFIVYLRRKEPKEVHKDPHWKYRIIKSISLLEKVVTNNQSERRFDTVIRTLNKVASTSPNPNTFDKLFLRTNHLETNKLNGFVAGFKNADREIKAKRWPIAAHRNTLRMMRTEFPDLTRSKSDWEICFKQCRANLSSFQEDEWTKAFEKNRKKFERLFDNDL